MLSHIKPLGYKKKHSIAALIVLGIMNIIAVYGNDISKIVCVGSALFF